MLTLQVSATTLDAFRRHLSEDGIPGVATDDDFVRGIISPVRETEAMRNGTMIHSILEDPHRWVFQMGGRSWFGTPDCCVNEHTLAQMQRYVQPIGAFEVPAWKAYEVWPSTAMVVTMRLDHVYADEVTDIKTVWSDRDDDWYYESMWRGREQSLQWRLYLDAVPGLTQARYVQMWMMRGLPEVTVRHVDVITLPRTHGLSDELEGWCREFFAFANRHHELINYLRERGARYAAIDEPTVKVDYEQPASEVVTIDEHAVEDWRAAWEAVTNASEWMALYVEFKDQPAEVKQRLRMTLTAAMKRCNIQFVNGEFVEGAQ